MISDYPVLVTGYAPAPSQGVVTVDHLVGPRRVMRAVKGFLMYFGLAIVSVFIPAAHFILVPLFLVTSFVALFLRLSQRNLVVKAHGRCPDCGAEQEIDMPKSWHLPVETSCRSCQRRLTLSAG